MLAMMEPPANIEEEFQDWYDSEHFPERESCAGFETAKRFVCVDGWPRYLALYDLTDVDVLHGPAYGAIAISRYSPWTHRIMSKVWGQYRAEGVQVFPGDALLGKAGRVPGWSSGASALPAALESQLIDGLRKLYDGRPDTAQVRVFGCRNPSPLTTLDWSSFALRGRSRPCAARRRGAPCRSREHLHPYTRQAPGAFPKST
jgi:hypothetical protein